jgi:hypothetical protein
MDLFAVIDQVVELLRSRGRVSYRVLKLQLQLDDEAIEALKDELIYAQHVAVDEDGRVLVWTGHTGATPAPDPTSSTSGSSDHHAVLAASSPCCFATWSIRNRSGGVAHSGDRG